MYGSAVPPSSPFPLERTNYCSCVGRHRRNQTNHMSQRRTSGDQPHLPIPIHARYRRCDPQRLVHIEAAASYLPHTPQSRYLYTFLFFSTTVISSIPSIAIYIIHSLRLRLRLRHCKPKYHTIPYLPRIFKLSIHPVRELVAGCSDSRSKTQERHPGGIANDEGELPYYPSWVISQRRRSWCCSVGRWAFSYGGGLCLLFMSRMYTYR